MSPRPIAAAELGAPRFKETWTWIYANGCIWATDGAIVLRAAPAGGETLAPATPQLERHLLARGETCASGPVVELVRLVPSDGDEAPTEVIDRARILNGGAYDATYVDMVERFWPGARWTAAPGIRARQQTIPAVARVDGVVVALLSSMWIEPPATPR